MQDKLMTPLAEQPKNHRILVIDDNRAIHEDFRKIFVTASGGSTEMAEFEKEFFGETSKPEGQPAFQIDSAYQGPEGLEVIRRARQENRPYPLAFVDVRMPPGWDGIETISRIWQEDPDLQVVICTAYSDYSWDEMLRKLGHTDRLVILKKPFDSIEVLQLAQTLTEKWQLSQQVRQKLDGLESVVRERTLALTTANDTLRAEIAERRQVEESLRVKTSALEAAVNGIVITDRDARILWVNTAFTHLTGYSAAEAIGQPASLLKSNAHDAAFYKTMWDTILAGKAWRGEIINRRKDGSNYTAEMTITPVLNERGEIQNFVAIKQDVSERKKFEQALAQERDLLQALMDNLPDYIYFKDDQSRFIRINKAQAGLLGLKEPAEAIGRTDVEFLFSRLARQALVDEGRIFVTGEPMLDAREQIHTASGNNIWVSATKVPIRDRDGKITGLVGVSRDITERRLAEEQLAYERHLLQMLMEHSPDYIYFKDLDSRFLRCSKTLAERFGFSRMEDVVGKSDFDFFSDEHARPAFEDEQEIIRTGKPLVGKVEQEFWKGHDEPTWALTSKLPLRNKENKIIGTFGISKDITALKKAEHERHLMDAQLRQAQKLEAVGQLAAGIAHEINTPTQYVGDNTRFVQESFDSIMKVLRCHEEFLAAAKNNSATPELIARAEKLLAASDLNYLYEQVPAAIRETLEGVERVSRIVRAMKEFSHPGGKEKSAADLNKAIESTVTVARNEWKYVSDLKLEMDPELPLVPCCLGEFNQCILNLVINAAHAIGDAVGDGSKGKGLITITTRHIKNEDGGLKMEDGRHLTPALSPLLADSQRGEGVTPSSTIHPQFSSPSGWAEIQIRDTGTGIPEHARNRVFDPFFTTKGVGKGTGQGLSIARSVIVDKHGGSIHFETEMGQGTCFFIRLPLHAKNAATERQAA